MERVTTYFQGVFSPEPGSPRQLDRAEPRVFTKSATFHERGSDLERDHRPWKYRTSQLDQMDSLTAIHSLSRPIDKRFNTKSRLYLEINSGNFPKNGSRQVQARERRDLGVAQLKRGDRVTDPKSQSTVSSHDPKKTR